MHDGHQLSFASDRLVDLRLLARGELKAVELFGLALAQPASKALDAVVCAGEAMLIDQVLVDRHEVALEPQLGLDEGAVGLAGRDRRRRRTRWPGWRSLR